MFGKNAKSASVFMFGLLSCLPSASFGSTEDVLYAVVSTSGITQDFGIIDPATESFSRINQIFPTGLGWPLGDIASQPDPINGYFFTRQLNPDTSLLDILAIKKLDGSTRWLNTDGSVVGYDTKKNQLILRGFVPAISGAGTNQLIAYSMDTGSVDVIAESFARNNTMWQAGGVGVVDSFNRQAFQLGSNDVLFKINLDDGFETIVELSASVISIAWDSKNQKLYGLANASGSLQVAEINYETGELNNIEAAGSVLGLSNYVQFIAPNDQRYYIQQSAGDIIAVSLEDGSRVAAFAAPLRLLPPGAVIMGSNLSDETVSYNITDPDSPIIKLGRNTVDFKGNSISSGDILIAEGALTINGNAEFSEVIISEGATLGGTGVVGGLYSSGSISPGNSIGTLSVQGDVIMTASSKTTIEIDARGNADQIVASGIIRVGGSLIVVPQSGAYIAGTEYVVFEARDILGSFNSEGLDLSINESFNFAYSTYIDNGKFYIVLSEPVTLIADAGAFITFSDNLGASAGVVTYAGFGTLLITGENTHNSGFNISNGVLEFTKTDNLGSGSIALSGATIKPLSNLIISNGITISAGGATYETANVDVIHQGIISGLGELRKTGSGSLILNYANTYTGGTDVQAGTLALGSNTAAGTGGIVMQANTTLQAASDLTLANIIDLKGAVTFDTQSFNVTLNNGVTNAAGGQLIKTGSGTLTLNGTNTYTGGTDVQAGTLALASDTAAGTGQIVMGNDTTLQASASISVSNDVDLKGAVVIDTQSFDMSLGGSVTNAAGGQVIKQGSGALTLLGANTYTGGTSVQAGTLALAQNTSAGAGAIALADDTTLQANAPLNLANAISLAGAGTVATQGNDVTLSGVISGAGTLKKIDSGKLTLSNANTYAGGTDVQAGTLALASDTAAGTGDIVMQADTTLQAASDLTLANIVDLKGAVTFDTQSFNVTLNNGVTNAAGGQLIKTGSGTLTLNGTNTYTGGTLIEEGTLALYGTLASFVTVGSGTVFGGTGTVNGDVTNAGTIQPRLNGARSTLTVVGNYEGQGGVFASTLGGTTEAIEADRLAIQGTGNTASGTTTITVSDPTGVLGRPTVGDGILLVDVSGGATSTTTAFNAPRIAAGAYEYTLVRGGLGSAQSWYLRADIDEPAPPVIVTPTVAQREEVALYPSLPSLARQYLWSINGTLDDRRGAPDAIDQWQSQPIAWGRFIGQDTQSKPGNVNNGPGLKTNEWALQLGADLWRSNSDWGQWRVGPVLTIGRSSGNAFNASGSVQTGRVGLNAYSLGLNATVASQSGGYADLLVLATRLTGVQANSPLGTSIATTGWAYSGSLEGGWRVPMTSKLAITPQAQIYNTTVNLNNATDAFSLIKMPSNSAWLGRLGMKLSYDQVDAQGPKTQFWARASVFSTLAGQDASTSFLNLVGTNPTTFQSRAPSTWLALDAALNVQATQNTSVQFGVGYQTSFNSQYRSVYGQINLRVGF